MLKEQNTTKITDEQCIEIFVRLGFLETSDTKVPETIHKSSYEVWKYSNVEPGTHVPPEIIGMVASAIEAGVSCAGLVIGRQFVIQKEVIENVVIDHTVHAPDPCLLFLFKRQNGKVTQFIAGFWEEKE